MELRRGSVDASPVDKMSEGTPEQLNETQAWVRVAGARAKNRIENAVGDGPWQEVFDGPDNNACAAASTRLALGEMGERKGQRVRIENGVNGDEKRGDNRQTMPRWGSLHLALDGAHVSHTQPAEHHAQSGKAMDAYNQPEIDRRVAALNRATDPKVVEILTATDDEGLPDPDSLDALSFGVRKAKEDLNKPLPGVSPVTDTAERSDLVYCEYSLPADARAAGEIVNATLPQVAKDGLLVATLPMPENSRDRVKLLDEVQRAIPVGFTGRVIPTAFTKIVPDELGRTDRPKGAADLGFTVAVRRPVPASGRPVFTMDYKKGLQRETAASFNAAKSFRPENATSIDGGGRGRRAPVRDASVRSRRRPLF